jgi:DHA2 family multidrug resistance protein
VQPSLRNDVTEVGLRRVLVTVAVISASVLELVDTTVVNVALPTVQGNLGADFTQGTWIVTGYVIANALVIPINPWLQRRFGRRAYYGSSIVAFTLASLACGLSTSLGALVCFRILQGFAGGGLIASGQAILADTYPRNEQGKAQGLFSIGVVMGPALGPLIGGWLTDLASWRWAFFINIPIGIVAAFLAFSFIRNPDEPRRNPIDVVGAGLLILGLGSLQFVLDRGQLSDWFSDRGITFASTCALVGLFAFIWWEIFGARNPIVDLRALAQREVWVGALLSLGVGFTLYAFVIIVPQFVQNQLGFTATLSGQLFLLQAGASFVATPISIMLLRRGLVQPRWQVAAGFGLSALSTWMLVRVETTTSDFHAFVLPLIISGISISQLFVPITLATLGRLPRAVVPTAAAFQNLGRQLGGSIATAILATIQQRSAVSNYARLASEIRLDRPTVARFFSTHVDAANQALGLVIAQASTLGFATAGSVAVIVALAIVPFALLLRKLETHDEALDTH